MTSSQSGQAALGDSQHERHDAQTETEPKEGVRLGHAPRTNLDGVVGLFAVGRHGGDVDLGPIAVPRTAHIGAVVVFGGRGKGVDVDVGQLDGDRLAGACARCAGGTDVDVLGMRMWLWLHGRLGELEVTGRMGSGG